MESLLVLPLVVREEPIGTLIVASRTQGGVQRFIDPRDASGACQPARRSRSRTRRRSASSKSSPPRTALTGCLNKRAFLRTELGQKLMAAQRFGRKLSLIVTDLDHFKSVNDTYGHATGRPRPSRSSVECSSRVKRETDLVARFGGEEFCVLCEETDARGAQLLAGACT